MKTHILLSTILFAAVSAEVPLGENVETLVDGFTETDREALTNRAEKHDFQAEVARLMDIIINLYSNKEVFLRELVSNAADALEKLRFLSLQNPEYLEGYDEMRVDLEVDRDAKTISIVDTGVGMTKADLINNLGTVAKSGTGNFLETLVDAAATGGADSSLIGQFGVGFYSAFLVADQITVTSKNHDDPVQHVWQSAAGASFIVAEDPRGNTLKRGTRVTLHLKEDAHEYLAEEKIKSLALKFSQFITFPIRVRFQREIEVDAEEIKSEPESEDPDKSEEDVDKSEDDAEKPSSKDTPKVKKMVYEYEQINTQKPIWLREKDKITTEEYNEFYKSISKDSSDPVTYSHFGAEGEVEFKSILFVPRRAPFDLMDNYWSKKSEVKLYVRRVLVADKFDELLPKYLNFIRGVVDSDDMPLNVSREQLPQNKIMKVVAKKLVRKALEMLKKLSKADEEAAELDAQEKPQEDKSEEDKNEEDKNEEDKSEEENAKKEKNLEIRKNAALWNDFYREFNKNIKMGCYEDDSNRSKISKLLRFQTSKSNGKLITLEKYVENMSESQDSIYYISGDDVNVMLKSPNMQIFKKRDIEVVLLSDHLDEPCIQKLSDFDGKKFVSVQKADLKFEETESEKRRFNKLKDMYKPLTDWWKSRISDDTLLQGAGLKVESVQLSKRLVDAPCVVVSSQFGYSAQQEKVLRAQAFQNKDTINNMAGRKTLEINANHPIIVDMLNKVKIDKDDSTLKDTASILFQAATIESGYEIQDPSNLVNRMYKLMSRELGVDPEAPLHEIEVPDDEELVDDSKKGDNEEEIDDSDEEDDDQKLADAEL